MSKPLFVSITDAGTDFLAQRPEAYQPGKHDYNTKPVRVAVRHDLSLELHGEHFSVSAKLSADDALGIIGMLTYVLREQLASSRKLQPAEAAK